MKKTMKLSLMLACMLILTMTLTSCGGGGSATLKSGIIGDWDSENFTNTLGIDSANTLLKMDIKNVWIRFTEDKMIVIADGEPIVDKIKSAASSLAGVLPDDQLNQILSTLGGFSYTVDGNKVKLTIGNQTMELTGKIEGDKLTLTDGKAPVEFTKHK